ncbi:MAG: hypothetical protein LBF65_02085 [Holosporales bacterium]|jgi:hypothetical protein|nr:hypothetical protein [Holosporales bacterium]
MQFKIFRILLVASICVGSVSTNISLSSLLKEWDTLQDSWVGNPVGRAYCGCLAGSAALLAAGKLLPGYQVAVIGSYAGAGIAVASSALVTMPASILSKMQDTETVLAGVAFMLDGCVGQLDSLTGVRILLSPRAVGRGVLASAGTYGLYRLGKFIQFKLSPKY